MSDYSFTTSDVKNAARQLAQQDPEFSYEGEFDPHRPEISACFYVREGSPSCMMGQALHMLGVPVDVLSEHEGASISNVLLGFGVSEYDDPDLNWLDTAQSTQDAGCSWEECVKTADCTS